MEHEPAKSDVFLTETNEVKDPKGAINIATNPDEAPTANRARKRMVLDAIRSKTKLCAFLSGVSSVLNVIFESADGNSNDEITWTDFLGHLASKRNPYFTLQLLPDNREDGSVNGGHPIFHRTPADRDGGQAPWFDKPFSIHYQPTTKKKGTICHTDVIRMGFAKDKQGAANAMAHTDLKTGNAVTLANGDIKESSDSIIGSNQEGEKLKLPRLKDPRYVVVSIRRDKSGNLAASVSIQKRRRACIRVYGNALQIDISIPPPSFKPVSLSLSRIFSILKTPKQVFFLTQ